VNSSAGIAMSHGSAPRGVLPLRAVVCYGVGSLFTSIYGTLPSVVLLYFMTSLLAIPPALAGAVIFTPKLLEVIIDPSLGLFSDRLRSRWGRRRPLMLLGVLGFALTFPWLFNPPSLASTEARATYMVLAFTACTLCYSLFFVPYLAMPAEMGQDANERTRLMAFRIAFLSLGVMVAGAGAPWLVKSAGGGLAGYATMGWVFAAVCVGAMLVPIFGTLGAPEATAAPHCLGLREQLRLAWANRPFVTLTAAYGLQACAQGAFAAALPYYVRFVLQAPQHMGGALFGAVTATALVMMALWVRVGRVVGKQQAYGLASAIYAAASLAQWWPGPSTPWAWIIVSFVVMGVGFGGMELFSHAMLPDATRNDWHQTGLNREALFSGLWIAVEKLGFAVGAAAVALLLHFGHFVPNAAAQVDTAQPDTALLAIRLAIAVVPAKFFLTSLWFIRKYQLPAQPVHGS
jgi:glycoside/pentoside/hexuronide:cation symporter, GPH family